jgi:hypothetical protein
MMMPREKQRNPHDGRKKYNHKRKCRGGRSEWRHVDLLYFSIIIAQSSWNSCDSRHRYA